jgi:hypothetical protein
MKARPFSQGTDSKLADLHTTQGWEAVLPKAFLPQPSARCAVPMFRGCMPLFHKESCKSVNPVKNPLPFFASLCETSRSGLFFVTFLTFLLKWFFTPRLGVKAGAFRRKDLACRFVSSGYQSAAASERRALPDFVVLRGLRARRGEKCFSVASWRRGVRNPLPLHEESCRLPRLRRDNHPQARPLNGKGGGDASDEFTVYLQRGRRHRTGEMER